MKTTNKHTLFITLLTTISFRLFFLLCSTLNVAANPPDTHKNTPSLDDYRNCSVSLHLNEARP